MKSFVLCCLVFFFVAEFVQAQTNEPDSIFFTGVVMDQENLETLAYAHYRVNGQKSKKHGISNLLGRFSFWVHVGDTICYSHLGYRNIEIVATDSLQKKQDAYLLGIFMSKDTFALQEVLILPRFMNLKDAFLNSKINSPEYVRAKNNLNSATYDALTKKPKKMDAKANTDMLIEQHVVKNQHKTMIPTQMTLGVSTENTMPELKRLERKQKMKIPNHLITDKEMRMLKRVYRHSVKTKGNE